MTSAVNVNERAVAPVRAGGRAWGAAMWCVLLAGLLPAMASAQTVRVSAPVVGTEVGGGDDLERPSVSGNGRYVAFSSDLSSLVSADTNQWADVFVRDLQSNTVVRVSVNTAGTQAGGASRRPTISTDGRYVAFESWASDLVAGDTNGAADIFVRDRDTDADGVFDEAGAVSTTRVSVATGGTQMTGGHATWATISGNGRHVAFISTATNLVAGDTNGFSDVFVHDRQAATTTRLSVSSAGVQATCSASPADQNYTPCGSFNPPSISSTGRYVVFESASTTLVAGDTNHYADIFLHDRDVNNNGTFDQAGDIAVSRVNLTTGVAPPNDQLATASRNPVISADGAYVAYETFANDVSGADTNTIRDIYLVNRATLAHTLVSLGTSASNHSNVLPAISSDGNVVVYESIAARTGDTNALPDVYAYNRTTTVTTRVSVGLSAAQPDGRSYAPTVSGDGRYVAFNSDATNLVSGDTNALREPFVADLQSGSISRVAVSSTGAQLFGGPRSSEASVSGDGQFVAFTSTSSQLVSGDTNAAADVFVYSRATGAVTRVSLDGANEIGGDSPAISADGRFVAFRSGYQIWLHDRFYGTSVRISKGVGGAAPNGPSYQPAISASGRYIAYVSGATNLVASDTNAVDDVFLFDRVGDTTERISVATGGTQAGGGSRAPSVNGDGRYVAFESIATNLVTGDGNGVSDVFVRDRQAATTILVSRASGASGGLANRASYTPKISANGQVVAFVTDAVNLLVGDDINGKADVYVRDLSTNTTTRASVGTNGLGDYQHSDAPAISSTGRYVAFVTSASFVPADTSVLKDVYVRDRQLNQTTRISTALSGEPNNSADFPAISIDGLYVAFESLSGDRVAVDTNRNMDVFLAPRTATADVDATLSTDFKTQYGLVPGTDGPTQDPDGDGLTNAQEAAAGSHPNGTFVRYLAEGANSTFFNTRIALVNPGSTASLVLVRYLKSDGTTVSQYVNVPALRRTTIDTSATTGLTTAEFSTVVETNTGIVVDRTMRWDGNHYGAHTETAVAAPATTWYLAEGSTLGDFDLFYLLQNPSATTSAQVRIRYLLPTGAPLEKTYTLGPNTRTTLWVNIESFDGIDGQPLSNTDVSGVVEVQNGVPIVAERAMYLGTNPFFQAGHESAGVNAPQLSWFLAEGATGSFFDLFILLANPGGADAAVRATYLLTDGTTYTKDYVVAANSRQTIWVDLEEFPGVGQALANVAVSTTIASTNNVPIVVERAMWWPFGPSQWYEAHNSPGATATGTLWALAEGEDAGADQTETYILIANTSAFAGSAKVTLLYEDGTTEERTYPLAANSRTNVVPRGDFAQAAGKRFGALVESLGTTPAQVVVERAMYITTGGVTWSAGTNALGTKIR